MKEGKIEFAAGGFNCVLVWSDRGLRSFEFRRRESGKAGTGVKKGDARGRGLPRFVTEAMALLRDYFSSRRTDFSSLPLDMDGCSDFRLRVYRAAGKIPYGRTSSYEKIAADAGSPGASRAVGMAMKRNRLPIVIPCHRVVRKDGSPGGFSSPGGPGMKKRLLAMESRD
ncbi:MAG: methylated-DNA--[protein]-cysteine S-methyltransferase [Pseudomonadota bacterium]